MAKKPLTEKQRAKKREHERLWEREHREARSERQRKAYWADPEKGRERLRARRRAAKVKKSQQ
jgi:hypothetical protein